MKKSIILAILFIAFNTSFLPAAEEVYATADREFLDADLSYKYSDVRTDTLHFLDRQRSKVTGLLESYRGSSVYYEIPSDGSFEAGHEPHLKNQAYTYDQATAIMIYTACGEKEKAQRIIEVLRKEFYRDKNGMTGLLTSYQCDDFSDGKTLIMGGDGDRIHVGPNMWVALACLQYIRITGEGEYLPFVIDIAKWAYSLPHYMFDDGQRGAVSMGSGWGPDWSKTYSTENCKDYYAVLLILERMYDQCSDKVKQAFNEKKFTGAQMAEEIKGLERWFKEVGYNKTTGGFNSGYNENGLDTSKALDTISNSISVIGPEKLRTLGIDPFRLLEFAEKYLQVTVNIKGRTIEGFDFTVPEELGNKRQRVIWIEGTAQMVLAYKIMSKYSATQGNIAKASEYKVKALKFAKELDKLAELIDLEDFELPYTTAMPGDQEKLVTYKDEWEIPRGPAGRWVASVASTAWRFFSLTYYNPMMMGKFTFCF